jgi:hypothetical protein
LMSIPAIRNVIPANQLFVSIQLPLDHRRMEEFSYSQASLKRTPARSVAWRSRPLSGRGTGALRILSHAAQCAWWRKRQSLRRRCRRRLECASRSTGRLSLHTSLDR